MLIAKFPDAVRYGNHAPPQAFAPSVECRFAPVHSSGKGGDYSYVHRRRTAFATLILASAVSSSPLCNALTSTRVNSTVVGNRPIRKNHWIIYLIRCLSTVIFDATLLPVTACIQLIVKVRIKVSMPFFKIVQVHLIAKLKHYLFYS